MLRRLAAHLAPAGAAADGAGDDAEVAVGAVPGVAHYTDPASGARTLIRTLVANDVTVCFSNPGTSEMHFVAGLDSEPEMRPVLVLQEVVEAPGCWRDLAAVHQPQIAEPTPDKATLPHFLSNLLRLLPKSKFLRPGHHQRCPSCR